MEAHLRFTAVFEPAAEGGYAVYVEKIPGVNTQGENLREALEMVLDVRREMTEINHT